MGAMRRRNGSEASDATNRRAQGCHVVTSDQRGFIQRKNRLIRDERVFGGNFHQTSMESGKGKAA